MIDSPTYSLNTTNALSYKLTLVYLIAYFAVSFDLDIEKPKITYMPTQVNFIQPYCMTRLGNVEFRGKPTYW